MRALANVLAAVVLAAGGFAVARSTRGADVGPAVPAAPAGALAVGSATDEPAPQLAAAPPSVGSPAASAAAAAGDVADPAATLLLPDGTRVAALNGARSPQPLSSAWPANAPFSPIVHVERSPAGVDWYVHADGSRSTTETRWRSDLGRDDAITRLARPTAAPAPAAPTAPASPH